jgi:YegS/Rv2252/BmrU family lipid kinase
VRVCVIFNPTAKGDKAKKFRRHLDQIGRESALKLTARAGDARRLSAEAILEGFDTIVAAGGDGTVNEVLNGIADVPNGFTRTRLGILPLGTVNVFARELAIPLRLVAAWDCVRAGNEVKVDLPRIGFQQDGTDSVRYFAQLAGAGLDARAIELLDYRLKKSIGPLAYVVAGFKAMTEAPAQIEVVSPKGVAVGALVLVGNGRLYGGDFRLFPRADLRDGLLDVCVFPKVNLAALARTGPALLLGGAVPESGIQRLQVERFTLSSGAPVPFEVDGEWCGRLPAEFSVQPQLLRVVVP